MVYSDRKYNNLIPLIIVFSVISVLCSIAAGFCGVSIRQCLLFACYQVCCVFIPGVALFILFKYSNRNNEMDWLGFVCICYALGYGLQIIAYFLVAFTGFRAYSAQVISGLFFVISVSVIIISAYKRTAKICHSETTWIILFVLFLILTYFTYSTSYILPGVKRDTEIYHADALYWIENAAAMTKSFPPAELRMSGTVLYYHYFASAYLAYVNLVTGIDIFSVAYSLYPFGKCLIFFGGLYMLSKSFAYDSRKQFFFLFILLFTTGLEKYSIVNYVAHILMLPFGFDISMGFGAFFLAYMIRQDDNQKINKCDSILTAFFYLMCAGHKAPVALVYLVFAGVLCLYWLVGRQIRKAFTNGLSILFCFLFVMIVCIGFLQNKDNGVSVGGFSHVATLRASPLFESYEVAALSRESGIKGFISVGLLYVKLMAILIFSINPLLLFLTVYGIIHCIHIRKMNSVDVSLVCASVFGFFMGLFNAQEGVSQMYYTLAVTIPAAVFGLHHMSFSRNSIQRLICCISAVLTVIQCAWFFSNSGVAAAVLRGIQTISGDYKQTVKIVPYSIQKSDYEALSWLRENTDDHCVILTDRSVLCDLDNYMYYGALSERQMYLEGDRYFYGTYLKQREERKIITQDIYRNSAEALENAAKDGVSYIVQTKWVSPEFAGKGCSNVFETDTITVWQIEK